MRISDWSSDVCSSDLALGAARRTDDGQQCLADRAIGREKEDQLPAAMPLAADPNLAAVQRVERHRGRLIADLDLRSEERRVGKESIDSCRARWSMFN